MNPTFRARLGGSCGHLCLAAALACASPALAADEEFAPVLKEVVVTAPPMDEPMVIVTDPHNPRQPVPPADGAGYLKNIPGFTVARKAGIDGDPLLRGQGGSRLDVQIDGAPLLGGCGNRMDPPTSYIFPDSFDSLKVLKGPQSVVHGGTALGSVLVDRETKRFQTAGARGNASALFGSFDRNDQTLDVAGGDGSGFARVIGTHSSSGDYDDGNGSAVHSRYWRRSGTLIFGWTPDADTRLELAADKSEAQAAYADRSMDGSKFDREGLNLHFSKKNISPLLAGIDGRLFYNYVDHVMDTYTLRPLSTMTTAASNPDHLVQGAKAKIELAPADATRITMGADVIQDVHSTRSQSRAEYLAGTGIESKTRAADMSFKTYAAFGEITQELGAADRVIAGYRGTRIEATKHNFDPNLSDSRTLHAAFGRYEREADIGVPATLYAGLGHIERAPDFWERNKATASNTLPFTMNKEKTNQLDLGLLFKTTGWRGALSLFAAHTDDYILVSSTNAKNVEALTRGGEAEIAYAFLPNWSVEATAAYVRGDNRTDKVALAQTPPLDTSLAVKYDDGVYMGGMHLRAVAAQDRGDPGWGNIIGQDLTTGGTGGFSVLSANMGWRPVDAVTLSAGIDNILDKTYAEHVSRTGTLTGAMNDLSAYSDNVRVNEPGRAFWMRGSAKF